MYDFSIFDGRHILPKLAKLIPEFSNAEKSAVNSRAFVDLLVGGINKQTATNFYAALEVRETNIVGWLYS